jgi:hypothetical protein
MTFPFPTGHSRESGNPWTAEHPVKNVPHPWIPAFAGMTAERLEIFHPTHN